MKTMRCKGYAARIEYSDEDRCFVGHIAGISDIVGFHGESVDELRDAFKDAVEDYIETCRKAEISPQRPYSGKLMLHIPPELHAEIAIRAEITGKSLDQWAAEAFSQAQL